MLTRRQMLAASGAALSLSAFPTGWTTAADAPKRKVLMFTRSQGFEHSVIKRSTPDKLGHAEQILTDLGAKNGFEVTCTKDGRVFLPENIAKYDAFFFYTTGDLTKEGGDKTPPMPAEGKIALLKAIAEGKGFLASHCGSDTFHSPGDRFVTNDKDKDPYIAMLGGEFIKHGAQQKAWMRLVDTKFPGAKDLKDFEMMEEWYSLKNFAPDLHVILVNDTKEMKGFEYERPSFPATWARMHQKGRVFYTSMGHREDVWTNKTFQDLVLGGLAWASKNVDADVTPNIATVTPKANELPVKK